MMGRSTFIPFVRAGKPPPQPAVPLHLLIQDLPPLPRQSPLVRDVLALMR